MPAAFLIDLLGRTYLFQAIKEKGLIAQKAGRLTILTHENIPPPNRMPLARPTKSKLLLDRFVSSSFTQPVLSKLSI
jgi:hypothetical protein